MTDARYNEPGTRPATAPRRHQRQPAEIPEQMVLPVEIISNLMFLIDKDCEDPARVRSYVHMAADPLRCLREMVSCEASSAAGE